MTQPERNDLGTELYELQRKYTEKFGEPVDTYYFNNDFKLIVSEIRKALKSGNRINCHVPKHIDT